LELVEKAVKAIRVVRGQRKAENEEKLLGVKFLMKYNGLVFGNSTKNSRWR
jgi:hypothetical protein